MDCNKNEAIRAQMLAEQKLTQNDIVGAKWFALKAQSLYPGLEGLSQLQELLHVYITYEKKFNGEPDWYDIFGVDPLADYKNLQKRYRKLALALHPDKNKSVGADGAFKILSEAWSVLSEKTRRDAYNARRNITASYEEARCGNSPAGAKKRNHDSFSNSFTGCSSSTPERDIKAPKTGDGVPAVGARKSCYNSSSSSFTKNPTIHNTPQTDSGSHASKPNSFWTSCKICKLQYEYVDNYRNKNLLCPNCWKPFLAVEILPPPRKDQMI